MFYKSFQAHEDSVQVVKFIPSENVVWTGSTDMTLNCWFGPFD